MNFGEAIERVKTRSYIARRANWDDNRLYLHKFLQI